MTVEDAAASVAQSLDPALQSVTVPEREPSRLVQDACTLEIFPETDAGFIQMVDLSGVSFAEDSFVWYGGEEVGNAIIVLEAETVGDVRWRKPNQESSPFPYALFQTARYVNKAHVMGLIAALKTKIALCSTP